MNHSSHKHFRREIRQGQATFGPTKGVTQMRRHAKHLQSVLLQYLTEAVEAKKVWLYYWYNHDALLTALLG